MVEQEVSIRSGDIELKGVLTLPEAEGPFPVLLFISGSGPIDRDDNVGGQELNNSRIIVDHLVQQGIAGLRFDKRGVGESDGDFDLATHTDLVNDAVACVEFLMRQASISGDKVFIAGHSEGSIIAPQVANRINGIAGIILLSPFCENMESVLIAQAHSLKEMLRKSKGIKSIFFKTMAFIWNPVKSQKKIINRIKTTDKKVIRAGLAGKVSVMWFRELFELDPADVYRNTTTSALLIGGSKDFQCDPADVRKIEKIYGGTVEAHVINNMSHLLRNEEEEPTIFNYGKQLKESIKPEVLEIIETWLKAQLGR